MKKSIVLTGGGSGGHFYPLIAVAEEIRKINDTNHDFKLFYLAPDPYKIELLQKNNISFVKVPAGKRTRYFSLGNFLTPFKLVIGTIIAIKKLYFIYPDVVFSKGGYASLPVVLAAAFLRIPIVIHESDSKVGTANKIAARFARYIAIAFPDVASAFPEEKTALVGIPLRHVIMGKKQDPIEALGLPSDKPLIFITGGSLGAEKINNLVLESLDELLPHYTLLHQTGPKHEDLVQQTAVSLMSDSGLLDHYFVRGTLTGEEMSLAQSAATLIVSRAGSTTIFEIAEEGKPSIIIPISEKVSHDQRTNAFAYARSGAAQVIEEHNLADGLLFAEINRIITDQDLYQRMSTAAAAFAKPHAAEKITTTLIDIAKEHK